MTAKRRGKEPLWPRYFRTEVQYREAAKHIAKTVQRTKTAAELAEQYKIPVDYVYYIVDTLRKRGVDIPRAVYPSPINDIVAELKAEAPSLFKQV